MSKNKDLAIDQLNQVKQRPILFNTEMVKGFLEDRKTMTRRLNNLDIVNENPEEWKYVGLGPNPEKESDDRLYAYFNMKDSDTWTYCLFPYGKAGDLLWVREKFRFEESFDFDGEHYPSKYWYYASTPEIIIMVDGDKESRDDYKWKPSIHMPKAAARIWLRITNIRVERLQDISEEDSKAEGVEHYFRRFQEDREIGAIIYKNYRDNSIYFNAIHSFRSLWIKINGKDSWKLNPWVWVIEFEKLELEKCESCSKQVPVEIMHCDDDANWFCPECIKELSVNNQMKEE